MLQEKSVIRSLHKFRLSLFNLELESPDIARRAKPGQFVHLRLEGIPGLLLRRPFSIAGVEGDRLRLIVRIVGAGTEGLSRFEAGQTCDALGPLGKSFEVGDEEAIFLIGGGIGDAPLLFLQQELTRQGRDSVFFLGGRTHDEFPLADDEVDVRAIIPCSDDGSYGKQGFVTAVFQDHLKGRKLKRARVFSCGPVPMMREASRICREHGFAHQVSLENRMGCGVGVCQGCALKVSEDGERGGYRLVCCDGPVFDAEEIDWSLFE